MGNHERSYVCRFENLVMVYRSILSASDTYRDTLIDEDPEHLPDKLLKVIQAQLDEIIACCGANVQADEVIAFENYMGVYKEFCLFERFHLPTNHRVVSMTVLDLDGNIRIVSVDKTLMV